MLMVGSRMVNCPILSLHIGGEIAKTQNAIIDPEDLKIVAYTLEGPLLKDPEIGDILEIEDVRELSDRGLVVDSTDVLTRREDVIRLDQIMKLNFDLIGLKVVTQKGKKIGKIVDYTFDSNSFMIYQLIMQRPLVESFIDPQLTINRSQIIEIDDYKVTIKHDKEEVKVEENQKAVGTPDDFVPNFVNPFKKPTYAPSDESSANDNSSKTSE